jgi:Ca2+/Na+ antiporter
MALTNKDGGFMMLKLLLDLSSYVLQLFFFTSCFAVYLYKIVRVNKVGG